jgi:predicted dehydrogenase
MSKVTRRRFVKTSAAAATATAFVPWQRVLGANERVRVGVAGINSRGRSHYGAYAGMKDVEVAYLIDPDSRLFDSRKKDVAKRQNGKEPKCVQDFRNALEDKDLDAISIATCNHWHSPLAIFSIQAGKDVYVEKPLSHNVSEGRIVVELARKHKRMVQHGTQQRSSSGRANEMAAVHSEKFGKLLVSKGYCCKRRGSIKTKPHQDPPKGLDFNMWVGPAAMQKYHGNLVHYNWHWFWDFGNGDIGNQGVHEMDVARWGIKDAGLPTRIVSLGGRLGYEDQGQTPNTQMTAYQYGDVTLLFEVRGLIQGDPKHKYSQKKVANEFYTTEGMITGGKFYPKNGGKPQNIGSHGGKAFGGGPFGNFINCVRSRKTEELNAESINGHYSAALCHLGNISYRLGEQGTWGDMPDTFGDNKVVKETYHRLSENLKEHKVPLDGLKYQVGRVLDFDPKTEKFTNSDAANKLLTRDYRKEFAITQTV